MTTLESQSQGSMGNKIAVDQFGGIHAVWTKTVWGNRPRYVYYNFRSEIDSVWVHNPDGTAISAENGTGYVTLDLFLGGEMIAAYHSADATPAHSTMAIDAFRGFGIFTEYSVNSSDENFFPHIARNVLSCRLHMVTTLLENSFALQYTYSTDNGVTWSDYALVDTADLMGYIIVASPVSDKTAILYCKQDSTGEFYDVFYNESMDGIAWDFRFPVNITGFTADDSLSTWSDIDAVYDYNDDIHIIYLAAIVQGGDISLNSTQLRHWYQSTGHNVITTGSDSGCAQVADCLCVAKPNLGVDIDNILFAVWSEMDYNDVSAGGYSNGELYAAYSFDYGIWWSPKVNITNSSTPGCVPLECDCDVWVSLAEKVDGKLHVLYIDDKDAGAYGQGIRTINPVMYLEVDTDILIPVSVNEENAIYPFGFELLRAYPNPFNARATIEFDLAEPGDVDLTIYDITGARVEELVDAHMVAGRHSVEWDATGYGSGTYFARITTGTRSKTLKMVLIK
ncbi:MAG: T9SS type A sorting domain-containing protein [Candidatus Zixiibacteriota bacterium]|nr:MAG: T9SS type A sorting domain-containing protein [candidate division Zixibacteria bacterium]